MRMLMRVGKVTAKGKLDANLLSTRRIVLSALFVLAIGAVTLGGVPQTLNVAAQAQPTVTVDRAAAKRILTGKIAFVRKEGDHSQIYVMNADGTGTRKLSNDPSVDDDQPAWSPDGKQIAFVRSRSNSISEIDVMNSDGADVRAVCKASGLCDGAAGLSWSPNGKYIVYGMRQINMLIADGSQRPAPLLTLRDSYEPAWSPDGQHIAYVSDTWSELYIGNADGSRPVLLIPSNTDEHVFCPTWSPNGGKLAFLQGALGFSWFGTINIDGTHRQSLPGYLTDPYRPKFRSTCPIWSPDGKYLVFSSNRDNWTTDQNRYDIFAVSIEPPHTLIKLAEYNVVIPLFGWFPYNDKP